MRFETQTNLYGDAPLIQKLSSHDTQFNMVQGRLSYLISDQEIAEWQDGDKTLTTRMNTAEATATEINRQISDMTTQYNAMSGQMEIIESSVNDYHESADQAIRTITQTKSRVTQTQPTAPYNAGDIWIKDQEIYISTQSRSGEAGDGFTLADWIPATKYTDDSELSNWISSDYASDKEGLETEIGKKRQVFTDEPEPPYSEGDLWVEGVDGDIFVCVNDRASGNFDEDDWTYASKYTDDSALSDWLQNTYATDKTDLQSQINGKVETWYQSTDPSLSWDASARAAHTGDLWYYTGVTNATYKHNSTYRWSGSGWVEQDAPEEVFDAIDGKAQIFTDEPSPPYNVGDLWFNSATSDILTCMTPKTESQTPASSDWVKRNKYTDDTTFNLWKGTTTYDTFQSFVEQLPGKIRLEVTGSSTANPTDYFSQTYGGDAVPTNQNSPAVNWTTDAERAIHVGNIYCKTSGEIYQYTDAPDGLLIHFSSQCTTEQNYDYVKIYYKDEDNNVHTTVNYSGIDFKGIDVFVPSMTFWLLWYTDNSQNNYYGFSIDSITHTRSNVVTDFPGISPSSLTPIEVTGNTYPESEHSPYSNNTQTLWKYTCPDALDSSTYAWVLRKDPDVRATRASVEILDDKIESKVDSNGVVSIMEQNADSIRMLANQITWLSDNSSMSADGTLTCSNAEVSGTVNASLGTIGGWTVTAGKIYGGDSETGVAVMQKPGGASGTATWVFAAGGTSHSSYADCPFRIHKNGNLYASGGKIANCNISRKSLYYSDTTGWGNTNLLTGTYGAVVTTVQSDATRKNGKFRATNSNGTVQSRYILPSSYSNVPITSGSAYNSTDNVPYYFSLQGQTAGANIGIVQDGNWLLPHPITMQVWIYSYSNSIGGKVSICPFYATDDPGYRVKEVTLVGGWQRVWCVAYPSEAYHNVSCGIVRFYPSKSTSTSNEVYVLRPHLMYGEYTNENDLPWWNEQEYELEEGSDTILGRGGAVGDDGITSSLETTNLGMLTSELYDGQVRFKENNLLYGFFSANRDEQSGGTSEVAVEYRHVGSTNQSATGSKRFSISGSYVETWGVPFAIHHSTSPTLYFVRGSSDVANHNRIYTPSGGGSLIAYPSISNSSDARLKKDIVEMDDNYMALLDELKPKEYRFRNEHSDLYLGFIAQDVISALEDLGIEDMPIVSGTGEGEDYYALDYTQFIPILVRKCQKQDEEIMELKSEIEELKYMVKGLAQK